MSDQQVLDLAAKAAIHAGLKLECPDELDGVYVSRCSGRNGYTWNPLEDDGDALRLAVKLDLTIYGPGSHPGVLVKTADAHTTYSDDCVRRAIVLAAAAIGQAMQEKH